MELSKEIVDCIIEDIKDDNWGALQADIEYYNIDVNVILKLIIEIRKLCNGNVCLQIQNPTIIQLCCLYRSINCFEGLARLYGADLLQKDGMNRSCVHYIALNCEIEQLRTFIELTKGDIKNFCQGDIDGLTPIHFAAMTNKVSMIKLLYEKGVPITNITDKKGRSPIDIAVQYKSNEAFNMLKEFNHDENISKLFIDATKFDNDKVLEYLLQQKKNIPDFNGKNLLRYAAQNGSINSIKLLFKHVYHDRNNELQQAFIDACLHGHTDIVSFLIKNGCNPNLQIEGMPSPLLAADKSKNYETFEYLIDNGAEIKEISEINFKIPSKQSNIKKFYDIFVEIKKFVDETLEMPIEACKNDSARIFKLLLKHIDINKIKSCDEKLSNVKLRLISATYAAINEKGIRSTDSFYPGKYIPLNSSADLYKKSENGIESDGEEIEEEEEDNEMDQLPSINSTEVREMVEKIRHGDFNKNLYDPNYGIRHILLKAAVDNNSWKILKVLFDSDLIPPDTTDLLISLLQLGKYDLILYMLDRLAPFRTDENKLIKLIDNLNDDYAHIRTKFFEKGVKLTGEPHIQEPPFDPEITQFEFGNYLE